MDFFYYNPNYKNYSRYLDGREPGTRPFCLLDYFPEDYLMVIDESHVTVSQVHAMYGGDRSRKENLVEYDLFYKEQFFQNELFIYDVANIEDIIEDLKWALEDPDIKTVFARS